MIPLLVEKCDNSPLQFLMKNFLTYYFYLSFPVNITKHFNQFT